jgi:hypothetical protein
MQPGRLIERHRRRGGVADFIALGFGAVAISVSFLLPVLVGHDDHGAGTTVAAGAAWPVILAYFATMAAGLLFIAHGMRVRGARPPPVVRRAVDAAVVVLGNAGGPERLLVVVVLVVCPAWFDFI